MAAGLDLLARRDAGLGEHEGGHHEARGRTRVGEGPRLALEVREALDVAVAGHEDLRPVDRPAEANRLERHVHAAAVGRQHVPQARDEAHGVVG